MEAGAVGTTRATAETGSWQRRLGVVRGDAPGPTLVVVAGLHGNEPAGVAALSTLLPALAAAPQRLRGELVALAGNRRALAAGRRFLDHDLNRSWTVEGLARVRRRGGTLAAEDAELSELDRELSGRLGGPAPVYLLDLHTTSGAGPPFVVLEDTLRNRAFALALPAPVVLGLEEELTGTLSHHATEAGATTAVFEAGRHDDPASVKRAQAAVWVALAAAGLLAADDPRVAVARRLLAADHRRLPAVVEVRYRHPVVPGDGFRMEPGFAGFAAVRAGRVLAHDDHGEVRAPLSGRLLMPLYQAQGADGFFLVRAVHPVWLRISAGARRLRLERILHLLPGVRRHPERPGSFLVDRRIARWVAPELFHLLGFRRQGPPGRVVTFSRRSHDVPRPGGLR